MTDYPKNLIVPESVAGTRLDRFLASCLPGVSRTRAQALIEQGMVTVDSQSVRSSLLLQAGQQIQIVALSSAIDATAPPIAEPIPVPIIFEDEALLVIDKPAGLVVHPAPGHRTGTLVNALVGHLASDMRSGPDDVFARPGIVHRLDKDTSGLMVVARTAASLADLAAQMKAHETIKRYVALVEGKMPVPEGVIEAPIGRNPRLRQRMAIISVAGGGREARTRFRVVRVVRARSLLELQLETGRTHQIRVHLAAVGHPVVGDPTYGHPHPPLPPRQFLHATHLEFAHPTTHAWLTFDSPLPSDLAGFLDAWYPLSPEE